jgi:signal transduction histidine kinase
MNDTPAVQAKPSAESELDTLVEARTRELSSLSTHLLDFAEREKTELARKLHDELGGLLTAAKMDLSWLQSRLEAPALQERLAQLGAVLDEAMDLKRHVVEELRPSLLDHFGLPTALRAYFDATCEKANLKCRIDIDESAQSMPRSTAIVLFRIAQEALANVMLHAHARHATLTLKATPGLYTLTIADDGVGFDSKDPQFRWSHGLMGMRQRARSLSGTVDIQSAVGSGTTLRTQVPVPKGP